MTFGEVITALGGNAALGRTLGIGASAVSEMRRRDSIPAEYWRAIVDAAAAKGRADITLEALSGMVRPRRTGQATGAAA